MQPQTVLFLVAALACPIAMGLMMWQMNRNMGDHPSGRSMSDHAAHTSRDGQLKALRQEKQRVEQEIAELEKIAALEEKKKSLVQTNRQKSSEN